MKTAVGKSAGRRPERMKISDCKIACPDPNCGARFRISRVGKRTQRHSECTVVPLGTQKD